MLWHCLLTCYLGCPQLVSECLRLNPAYTSDPVSYSSAPWETTDKGFLPPNRRPWTGSLTAFHCTQLQLLQAFAKWTGGLKILIILCSFWLPTKSIKEQKIKGKEVGRQGDLLGIQEMFLWSFQLCSLFNHCTKSGGLLLPRSLSFCHIWILSMDTAKKNPS